MMLDERGSEALAPFTNEIRVLVSGIQMLAHDFWQGASLYLQQRYTQYALSHREFCEISRKYDREVANGKAIDLGVVCEFVDETVGLFGFDDDEVMDTTAQGKNLRNTATLLCVSGMLAGQGDLEVFMRRLRGTELVTPERYRELIAPENRMACAFVIGPLYEAAAHRYAALAKKRGVTAPHVLTLDGGCAAIDREVVSTGYLVHKSILDFLEPIRGRA